MFGTIRKHSTWLWLIIIAGIIVSFVVYFTPSATRGFMERGASVSINGHTFNRDQVNAANREVQVSAVLGLGRRPETDQEATQRAFERLMMETKLEEYGISVGPEATADWIRDRILRPGGPFAGMTLEQVGKQFITPAGYSVEDLTRFAKHQAGFEVLLDTLGSAASLITPQELKSAYLRENQKLAVDLAFVANSNYLAKVTLNQDELMKFYSNRVAAYRSPDRVQVHYVRFATSNYVADAETELKKQPNFNSQVSQTYETRGTNYYPNLSQKEAEGRIRQEIIDEEAFKLARRKAYDFINMYYDSDTRTSAVMAETAKSINKEMKTTTPFSRDELPKDIGVGPEFVDAAFKLTKDEPFSTAISAADGYYALCFDQKIPGSIQPYDEVKDKVQNDFREDRARTLTREAADQFYQALTNGVPSSQAFTSLAKLSGFEVFSIPDLTLRTTSVPGVKLPVDVRQIAAIANNMETNTISRPQFATGGLYLLHTGERTPPTEAEVSAGLVEYRNRIRQTRDSEILNTWISKQMEISGVFNQFRNPTQ